MRAIFLAAMLAATPALADLVIVNRGGDELRLMSSPCVHGQTLGHLKPEYRPLFKKAQARVKGAMVYACWIDTGDGAYFLIWEDGSDSAYPVTSFTDEPGV